mmetsp:Transcript_38144/g.89914  ORF Transcript_38144/g.89914 Transcript_38144/m.89914 type:complete len:268 (+) Transcript_38144:1110-1913(+)
MEAVGELKDLLLLRLGEAVDGDARPARHDLGDLLRAHHLDKEALVVVLVLLAHRVVARLQPRQVLVLELDDPVDAVVAAVVRGRVLPGLLQVRDLLRAVLDLLLELRELVHAALLGDQLELRPPHPSSAPDRAHSAHRRLAADPTLSPAISSLHCASCADTSTSRCRLSSSVSCRSIASSTSSLRRLRSSWSMISGWESSWQRTLAHASSMRSIALSGRNRPVMYLLESSAAEISAPSVMRILWCISYLALIPRSTLIVSSTELSPT